MNSSASSDPGTPILALADIGFAYRAGPPVLDGITLNIARGERFGLLGPNGAGKTTLISLLAGLLPVQHGSIHHGSGKQAVALIPQEYAFYPMLTVAENLRFFCGALGLTGCRAQTACDAAIAFAHLDKTQHRRAGELSGGLKRRLNLGIGLLSDPEVLLLDEPTAGVDPQSRHFLLESIAALGARGKTIVYTSHHMDEVEALCRRIAIIDHGRILACGTIDEILNRHAAEVARDAMFRLRDPLPAALADALRASHDLRPNGSHSYRLRAGGIEALNEVLERLRGAGCIVTAAAFGERTLEDVFMHLTQRSLRD